MLLVSHDRAVLDAVPDRIVSVEHLGLRSTDGGWADLVRDRERRVEDEPTRSPAEPKAAKPRPAPPRPKELDQVEKRIGELEPLVAELEGRLAENWTDMDLLASYTSGREELDALLARWEVLFAEAQAGSRRRPGPAGRVARASLCRHRAPDREHLARRPNAALPDPGRNRQRLCCLNTSSTRNVRRRRSGGGNASESIRRSAHRQTTLVLLEHKRCH